MNTPLPKNLPPTNRWRSWRRCLVGLAVCLTLIVFFYTEELWRGKRAWENCKRALQAQGVKLDWADYIPAPVPENENFFGVPEMQKWFNGRGPTELSRKLSYAGFSVYTNTTRMVVAEVTIGLPGMLTPDGATALRWDDPASRAEAAKLLTNALEPTTTAPQSPMGLGFMLRRPEEIRPARIFLQCQTAPTEQDLRQFVPDTILQAKSDQTNALLEFEPASHGSYHVTVPMLVGAADYLAWSETFEPQFALIRQALQRPYARMNGNYAEPVYLPIPNFPSARALGQTLGGMAECHFLLGQPEEALRDLTLMHDTCRPILEENKPMTLVSAMINVAIRGLYASTIADGLRLQAWQEPQLAALEEQLKTINVLPPVNQAFGKESAAVCQTLETTPWAKLLELFMEGQPGNKTNSWTRWKTSVLGGLMPRGWLYQNMVTRANLDWNLGGKLDSISHIIFPDKVQAINTKVDALSHWSPYTFMAAVTTPNFTRAYQTTAYNQTLVQQALIACALERYHLAHGAYPETLDALIPQFIADIPHDVIGGEPPHYRRVAEGKFILYSIGWDGGDHNGVPGSTSFPFTHGDWVWPD
jgi:hypothetical protein